MAQTNGSDEAQGSRGRVWGLGFRVYERDCGKGSTKASASSTKEVAIVETRKSVPNADQPRHDSVRGLWSLRCAWV